MAELPECRTNLPMPTDADMPEYGFHVGMAAVFRRPLNRFEKPYRPSEK